MRSALRHKPSATIVVAILALVVAASGTAVAAGQLSAGDQLIKKRSLSGNRLRNGTITGKQVNVAKLGKVPSATNADHATNADRTTNADHATNADKATSATTAGSASISQLAYESTTVTLGSSGPAAGTAACPAGLDVVAGGAQVSDRSNDFVIDTAPAGRTGWEASGFGSDGDTMIVSAICAPAAQTAP